MGRVAIVTGGTRGIGEAIAVALKEAGFKVAANYGGNDEAEWAGGEGHGHTSAAVGWTASPGGRCGGQSACG